MRVLDQSTDACHLQNADTPKQDQRSLRDAVLAGCGLLTRWSSGFRLPSNRFVAQSRRTFLEGVAKISFLLVVPIAGCGYTINGTFNRDIKTVAVPIFLN